MNEKIVKVGLLGFGTVGSGAVKTLLKNRQAINERAGAKIQLVAIADLDWETDRGVSLEEFPDLLKTKNAEEIIKHPDIDIVIESIGGTTISRHLILKALESGKSVVTANKALLAEYAEEVFGTALKQGTRIGYEGAVGGGIPLIESIDGPLASSRIDRIWGILNGTCNYILTKMESGEGDFSSVLKEAQDLGYAEADPTLDVEGIDTAHKIALLASQCFGQKIEFESISVEGITRIEEIDIDFSAFNGFRIKLLGIARQMEDAIDVRVHPALVTQDSPMAQVRDVFNAVYLRGYPVGGVFLSGRGAGALATGGAVIADLIQLVRGENGTSGRYDVYCRPGLEMMDSAQVENHYYIRTAVDESSSALGDVVSSLVDEGIPVDMADRIEAGGKKTLILTGRVSKGEIDAGLQKLAKSRAVVAEPYAIPIEEIGE